MNKADRVVIAHLPAAVDHFLAAAFHFRVVPLNRGKVQVFVTGARVHGRRRATTQADQHRGATQYNQLGANRDITLLHMIFADVTQTTGNHDGLVVAAHFLTGCTGHLLLEGTEVAGQVRTAEFVVERSAANRAFNHDIQR